MLGTVLGAVTKWVKRVKLFRNGTSYHHDGFILALRKVLSLCVDLNDR